MVSQPSVGQHRAGGRARRRPDRRPPGRRRTAPVAAHHRGRAQPDPAHLAGGHRPRRRRPTSGQRDPGDRPAHRGGHHLVGVAGHGAGAERRLGRGVADHHRTPNRSAQRGHQFGRAPGRPRCRRSAARRASAPSRSGWASTRAHWVGTPWATVIRSSAMIRMVSAARHGVGVITVVTPLAISSQVRVIDPTWAKGGGTAAGPRLGQHVGAGGHRGQAGVVEHRPLGQPGGPAGPHHGHRIRSVTDSGNRPAAGPSAAATQSARPMTTSPAGPAGDGAPSSTTVTAGRVRSRIERTSVGPRRRLIPEVIGPQPGGGGVGRPCSRSSSGAEADHRAAAHAVGGEQPGDPVGGPVPLGEGQVPAGRGRPWPARRRPRRRR